MWRVLVAVVMVVLASSCVCESNTDAGWDAGPSDSGRDDDAGVDAGDAGPVLDGGCWLVELTTLPDPALNSVAVGISPNGQAIAINVATLSGMKSGLWFADGGLFIESGFTDISVAAVNDATMVGTVTNGTTINPAQAYRRNFRGPIEVLSETFESSDGRGVGDEREAVGSIGFSFAVWNLDGGPGKVVAPASVGAATGAFASQARGVTAGTASTNTNSRFALSFDGGAWLSLPCPRINCAALAIADSNIVGHAGGPVIPARWTLPNGEFEELETVDTLVFGQALAVRSDGLTGGVLVRPDSQSPRDGVGVLWANTRLIWRADELTPIKVVSIVGLPLVGNRFAANCYEGTRRVACIAKVSCN